VGGSITLSGGGAAREMPMKQTTIHKRSVLISGRKTSVSLEDQFWQAVQDIAQEKKISVRDMIDGINKSRIHKNLSSAVRLYVLQHYQSHIQQGTPDCARSPGKVPNARARPGGDDQ
jgi:predicted DNA-binding ribbon-helix-helix protein